MLMTSAAVARSIYKQCTRKQKRSCHRLIRRAALLSLCQFTDPPAHPITFNRIPTQLNTTTKLNAMATFKMQDSTGAAATQAGLSEERSNSLIVTGLPATSATSAKETLTKHLLHLLEISGVPPSRQHKYTTSLAQASLGNIDGHPVNADSCAIDGPYEKGEERDPTKTMEDQSSLDLTLVSAHLNKFQPITIDGTVFNLGAHFAASNKDDLTRTISCSFVSTGSNADNKWADLAKVPVSELEKAAGKHFAELGIEVSYIFVYSMTRTNTAPRVLRVVLKHAHSGDIDKVCSSSFSQVCLATTSPVMNEEITVVGSFNDPATLPRPVHLPCVSQTSWKRSPQECWVNISPLTSTRNGNATTRTRQPHNG
ncbi:hypothetical protein MVLG_05773 [Microbotryum lychnidis-dioicae p1A1 Lamole]|uniref:Uncharacterized protein n=1 Tax=Microbotryum lychnidis-dioicae (strain p1A1 Lamole / MvSl-1064) TaxID=683840 RepID=U5HF93_USTV1|nr:hypothetical protein MVLG_05773 [Microbotryum lychnidis-dioicae p1A1 Lamole]|eukprot:KDE03771.1 hypothetical protein MVLG_05773 [Microbotryum lychnidis-dioicae p1A1 Lamole]